MHPPMRKTHHPSIRSFDWSDFVIGALHHITLRNILLTATIVFVCDLPKTFASAPSTGDDRALTLYDAVCKMIANGDVPELSYVGTYNVQGVFPGTFDTAADAIQNAVELMIASGSGKVEYNATGNMTQGAYPKEYIFEAIYMFPTDGIRPGFGELNKTMKMWGYSTSVRSAIDDVLPCIGSWFVVEENGQNISYVTDYYAGHVPWGAWDVLVVDDYHKCISKNPDITLLNDSGFPDGSVMLMYNTFGQDGFGYEMWTPIKS